MVYILCWILVCISISIAFESIESVDLIVLEVIPMSGLDVAFSQTWLFESKSVLPYVFP